ncbi:MAG: hypothetical protein HY543_02305 [Deltaproteobacteria bacterium]|nr:hypothetical protein [Deltaproteobacteria bacterium]
MAPSLRIVERRLKALMRLWAVLFFGMAIVQAFYPTRLVAWVNAIGTWLGWTGPTLQAPPDRFFSSLAVALLVLLAILAYNAATDLKRRLSAVRAILVAKVVSATAYLFAYLTDAPHFAYIAGIVADGGIAAITYYYYRRARFLV